MTLLIAIPALWLAALVLVVALCRGAQRGDEGLAAAAADARRARTTAGVVVIDGPASFSARDLRDLHEREPVAPPAYAAAVN
jgi:hypothetical protein